MSQSFHKVVFASGIKPGDVFDDIFLLEDIVENKKKDGESYWVLTLRDRTGSFKGKVWGAAQFVDEIVPIAGRFVKIRVKNAKMYRGALDVSLEVVRPMNEADGSPRPEDFVPVGPKDRFEQFTKLVNRAQLILHEGLCTVTLAVLMDTPARENAFRNSPAAQGVHQPYVGGLVDHVLSMMRITDLLCDHYELDDLTRDILIAACVWHDVGKTKELRTWPCIAYTDEGQLVGHMAMSLELMEQFRTRYEDACIGGTGRTLEELDATTHVWLRLRHVVAGHHGLREWRTIQPPVSREAHLFHCIDLIDSRMAMFDEIEKGIVDEDGFWPWDKRVGAQPWRP